MYILKKKIIEVTTIFNLSSKSKINVLLNGFKILFYNIFKIDILAIEPNQIINNELK